MGNWFVITGVAQNHSNLFHDERQRLPGLREGQIYSYPCKRWRKKRRQYLLNFMQPRYVDLRTKPSRVVYLPKLNRDFDCIFSHKNGNEDPEAHPITTVENVAFPGITGPSLQNEDSNASAGSMKDDVKQVCSNSPMR